jgi:hypothetical protein
MLPIILSEFTIIIVNALKIILPDLETFLKKCNLLFSRRLCSIRCRFSTVATLPTFGSTSKSNVGTYPHTYAEQRIKNQ